MSILKVEVVFMKNMMFTFMGVASMGLMGYALINKRTRKKAEELFESMVDEADKSLKSLKNI